MSEIQPIDLSALEQPVAPVPAVAQATVGQIAPAVMDDAEGLSVQEQIARTGTYTGAPGNTAAGLPSWLPENCTEEEKALLQQPVMSLEEISWHVRRQNVMIGRLIGRIREGNHHIAHQIEESVGKINERINDIAGMGELSGITGLYKILTPIVQATERANQDKQMGRTVRMKFIAAPSDAGPEDKVVAVNVTKKAEGDYTLYIKGRNAEAKLEDITAKFGPAVRMAIAEQTDKAGYATGQFYWAVINNLIHDPNAPALAEEAHDHDHHH